MPDFIPSQGDIIDLTFDPQSGHEQRGRRPALVISKDAFNKSTGLAIVCPLTNTDKRYPFHVAVSEETSLSGFVMAEQVKSVDFRARKASLLDSASPNLLADVLSILDACLY